MADGFSGKPAMNGSNVPRMLLLPALSPGSQGGLTRRELASPEKPSPK